MAEGKHKNRSNRNQGYLASSEPNSHTITNNGYIITPEKQDMDLKSLLMMIMKDFKKEIQENTVKELESFKRKHKNAIESYRKTLPNRRWK
jgi:rRNA-processing protein FCF1